MIVLLTIAVVLGLGLTFVLGNSSPTGLAGSPAGAIVFDPTSNPCDGFNDLSCPESNPLYDSCGRRTSGDDILTKFFCLNIDPCSSGASCSLTFELDQQEVPKIIGQDNNCGGRVGLNDPGAGTCIGTGEEGNCLCPCVEGSLCDTSPSNDFQCGGIAGTDIIPAPCLPIDFFGPFSTTSGEGKGACDCNNDGCTAGAPCEVSTTTQSGSVEVCGPNGFCQLRNPGSGEDNGFCICDQKACQLVGQEEFNGAYDQCPGTTTQCEPDAKCNSNADCGGAGLGSCNDGFCDCECVSWANCDGEQDCGSFGESGSTYGRCKASIPDGVKECVCTDDLGCSPDDCIVGVTPCAVGESFNCGNAGEDACDLGEDGEGGICNRCGVECTFQRIETGSLSQADCNDIAQQIGTTKGCDAFDFDQGEGPGIETRCSCPGIPQNLCRTTYNLEADGQAFGEGGE